jgi:hypothetical protein
MLVPERVTRNGRVVPAFLIDDQFAEEVLKRKWCPDRKGYLHAWTSDGGVSLARFIWFLHTGDWPKQQIDHINRDKLDNRVANLRDVSLLENMRNRKPEIGLPKKRRVHPDLPTGVHLNSDRWRAKPYQARVGRGEKRRFLGNFATPEEASAAYQQEVERLKHEALA